MCQVWRSLGRHRHGAAGPGRAVVEGEREYAHGLLGRRVDAAEACEQLAVAGLPVRIDARGVLRAEQFLEGAVRGDPLHDDVDVPSGVPVVEDDRVADADVAPVRHGDPRFDRLAPGFNLPAVPPDKMHVVLGRWVSGRGTRDCRDRLLGVVRHACLRSELFVRRDRGVRGAVMAVSCASGAKGGRGSGRVSAGARAVRSVHIARMAPAASERRTGLLPRSARTRSRSS